MISVGHTVRFSRLSQPLGVVIAVRGEWATVLFPNGLTWPVLSSSLEVVGA